MIIKFEEQGDIGAFITNIKNQIKIQEFFDEITLDLIEKNRFSNDKLDSFIKTMLNVVDGTFIIPKGTTIYRARIYSRSDDEKTKHYPTNFYGYSKELSMSPPSSLTPNGRCNPQNVRCLYTSEHPDCSVYEVRPQIDNYISRASISVKRELKLFNISKISNIAESPILIENYNNADVMRILTNWFSRPIDDEKDYIVTQYISEKLKAKFDGIAYASSIFGNKHNLNYAIFDIDSCEAVSSELVRIPKIELEILKNKIRLE